MVEVDSQEGNILKTEWEKDPFDTQECRNRGISYLNRGIFFFEEVFFSVLSKFNSLPAVLHS